jgi:hypothetical protein
MGRSYYVQSASLLFGAAILPSRSVRLPYCDSIHYLVGSRDWKPIAAKFMIQIV